MAAFRMDEFEHAREIGMVHRTDAMVSAVGWTECCWLLRRCVFASASGSEGAPNYIVSPNNACTKSTTSSVRVDLRGCSRGSAAP